MTQPRPLDAYQLVVDSAIESGGVLAGRDLKPGDVVVDLLPRDQDHPAATTRHQPRAVAQEIPAGTELAIAEDGRVVGVGLESPAPLGVATIAGIPISADPEIPEGRLELRNPDGVVLSAVKLTSLASDEALQRYVERMLLQGGAAPFANPLDSSPDAPNRYDEAVDLVEAGLQAEGGVMGHQTVEETATVYAGNLPDLDPVAAEVLAGHDQQILERVLATALGELDQVTRRRGRVRSIYVASSWRNPHQPHVVEEIRAALAAEVYDFRNPPGGTGFAWSSIDPDWESWTADQYLEALEHPLAEAGFASDFDAMTAADTFVLVLPCGRSAHLELGWAVGAGKRTVILTSDGEEPELMAKMVDHIATSVDDVIEWLVDQDAEAHHDDVARGDRLERIWAEIDQVPIPFALEDGALDKVAAAGVLDPDRSIDDLVAGVVALEEVAVAAAIDVDVEAVELLRDAANALRLAEDGPAVIRHAISAGLEHAARTLEAGNPVEELDEVLEIAAELAAAAAQACRVCGCTNEQSCEIPGRCAWEEPDLCTNPACLEAARS